MARWVSERISFIIYLSKWLCWCFCFCLFISRGSYMNSGTSQSLSGALNRQNQLMQGGGMQGGAFGRRYWAPPHHFGLCTYFFFKKLTSEAVPVHFLMETCIFLVYFLSSVWCSDFRHCKASFIIRCMYSTTLCRNVSRLLISSVVHSDVNTHLAWWTWPHCSWFTQISEAFCGYFLILLNEIFLAMVNVFRTWNPHFWHIFCMKVFRF